MYVQMPILEASHQAASSFLSTATPTTIGAFTSSQQAALGTPFAYQEVDLRPILPGQWAGAAPLEAGLIYYVRPSSSLEPAPCAAAPSLTRARAPADHLRLPHRPLLLLLAPAASGHSQEEQRQDPVDPRVPPAHRARPLRLLHPLARVRPPLSSHGPSAPSRSDALPSPCSQLHPDQQGVPPADRRQRLRQLRSASRLHGPVDARLGRLGVARFGDGGHVRPVFLGLCLVRSSGPADPRIRPLAGSPSSPSSSSRSSSSPGS